MDMDHNEHEHQNHHGISSSNMSCPMIMTFHFGHCESILWKSWTAKTVLEFFFSALGIFLLSFIYEYLKYLREKYYHSVARSELIRITKLMNNGKCLQNQNYPLSVSASAAITVANGINNSNSDGGGHIGSDPLSAGGVGSGCCINLSEIESQKTLRQKLLNQAHLCQTLLHLIQVIISYLLMLIVMSFNYWLCLAVVLGAACGYFCFGWIRQQSVDFNEHCH